MYIKKEGETGVNYFAKTIKNGKTTSKCSTHKIKRFRNCLRMINWREIDLVYLRVDYGLLLDYWGEMSKFINEGEYENPYDLWLAFNAFIED